MKKPGRIKDAFFEMLFELILMLFFIGIGFLVLYLFGVKISYKNTDPELLAMIGFGAVAALFAVGYAVWRLIKKIQKKRAKK